MAAFPRPSAAQAVRVTKSFIPVGGQFTLSWPLTFMQVFDLVSGIIPAALQLALAIIMLRCREYRRFPFLFS
jgi:hypothetical protein